MRKKGIFHGIMTVVLLAAFLFGNVIIANASEIPEIETDVSQASEKSILIDYEGRYIIQAKEALNRINEIRLEACKEGINNPDTSEPMTIEDYVPLKWSSNLEYIARIRAAEANLYREHVRPNLDGCFALKAPDGEQSWAENLAWNYDTDNMIGGINQWYEEKENYITQNGGVVGHYTSMINPKYNYVALGDFYKKDSVGWPNTVAAEFSFMEDLDETENAMEGNCIQKIEVSKQLISDCYIDNECADMTEKSERDCCFLATYRKYNNAFLSLAGCSWLSSDPSVASVDEKGHICALSLGKTVISVSCGEYKDSFELNVKKENIIQKKEDAITVYTGNPQEISQVNGENLIWKGTGEIVDCTYYIDEEVQEKTTNANSGALCSGGAPINAGIYYVAISVAGDEEYCPAEIIVPLTIKKADPMIGKVSYQGNTIYDDDDCDRIRLIREDKTVPGSLYLDECEFIAGENEYGWTFEPDDCNNYEVKTGNIVLSVQQCTGDDEEEELEDWEGWDDDSEQSHNDLNNNGENAGINTSYSTNTTYTNTGTSEYVWNNDDLEDSNYEVSKPTKVQNIKCISRKKGNVCIRWKKISKAAGYQIQYASNKKFTKAKIKTTGKNACTLSIPNNWKKGYVRIRAWVRGEGKVYGKWSSVKKIK